MESKGNFEFSLRVLGNELVGFSMSVDDFKAKWVILGVMSAIALSATIAGFGPEIKELLWT